MTPADWIKLIIIIPVFFGLGPALGAVVKGKPEPQRWLFAAMCFMTINGLFVPGNWGLTLASEEFYRGHAKGYHFYFNHIFAIALLTAQWLENRKDFRWVPPGMLLYAIFIITASISIKNAPRPDYVFMAIHKMVFFALIALATFNTLKKSEDLQFFMRVMAVTMLWEVFIVLKMKYLQGIYQVRGTFEHQNPLSMYAVMIGMPLLSVALGPKFKGQGVCLAGFAACGIIVQSALSRAALLMFAAGAVIVAVASLVEKPTTRRISVLSFMSMVGALGLMLTLDTIVSRFHDEGNTASSELREVLNEAAKQMEQAYPMGIGWNHYALEINTPYPYADFVYDWIRGRNMKVDDTKPNAPVESHYYLLIGENGYPGLIAWLLVIGSGVFRNIRGFLGFRHGFERCLCLGIVTGTGLNYIQSTLERVLTQPRNLMLWLIMFGITARLEMMRRKSRQKSKAASSDETSAGSGPGDDETDHATAVGVSSGPAVSVTAKWPSAAAMSASVLAKTISGAPGASSAAASGPQIPGLNSGLTAFSPPAWSLSTPPKSGFVTPRADQQGAIELSTGTLSPKRQIWRKRRFWFAGLLVVLTMFTLLITWFRGRQTRIIVINGGEETLPAISIMAGGQTHEVRELEAEESHRWVMDDGGPEGPVTLMLGGHTWSGGYLKPLSGQRIVLRIMPEGTVEEELSLSPWQDWLGE